MLVRTVSSNENNSIYRLMRNAVLIRLFALIIIACSASWEPSFIRQGVTDDWKYEQGAILFEKNANSLFDVSTFAWAFNSVDSTDWVGYHLNEPISYSVLWYLIVCLLVWITKTKYSIRLFNVFLSVISMKYIYNFANKIWGKDVAYKSLKLYSYLPYPIIFCCFGYKEELVLFCTFYLLSKSVDYRMGEKWNFSIILKVILVAVLLMGVRSGISLILFVICLTIMFVPDTNFSSKLSIKKIIPFVLMFIIVVIAFARFGWAIIYKAGSYLGEGRGGTDTISILMINSFTDIWKLPFSYMYSILMPISLFKPLDSWVSVVDTFNIVMIPISVGCMLYLVLKKKSDRIVYWSTLAYYSIYVIASLNFFRQYVALLPLNLMYYSAFWVNAKTNEKQILFLGSGLMAVILVIFFIL